MKCFRWTVLPAVVFLSGCLPFEAQIHTEVGTHNIMFYPGGSTLDDLMIINGINYFGAAQYQIDDPIGDIGFRFNDNGRVRAECISVGRDFIGQPECKLYEIFSSDFELLPAGTKVPKPTLF